EDISPAFGLGLWAGEEFGASVEIGRRAIDEASDGCCGVGRFVEGIDEVIVDRFSRSPGQRVDRVGTARNAAAAGEETGSAARESDRFEFADGFEPVTGLVPATGAAGDMPEGKIGLPAAADD